jgi:signal peptidase I
MKNTSINIALALSALLILVSASTYMAPYFGWLVNGVGSGSMSPTLTRGTLVIARQVNPDLIRIGDIIIINNLADKKIVICHRVVDIQYGTETLFITKGDANAVRDGFDVTGRNIAGKVIAYLPAIGNLIWFIKTPLGFIVALVIPGLFLISRYLVKMHDFFKHNKTDKDKRVTK